MTAQSGFLDCFLKFLNGEQGDTLMTPVRRGRPQYRSAKTKNDGTLPCENVKRRSGRPCKTPKANEKIDKEKIISSSDDIGSVEEKSTELDESDTLDSESYSRCHETGNGVKVVNEDVNKCASDKVQQCEENMVEGLDEKSNLDSLSKNKDVVRQSNKELNEDKDFRVEEEKDSLKLSSGQRKSSIDEASECNERGKQNSVILNLNASSLSYDDENTSHSSATDTILEEGKKRGKKRKNKTDIQDEVPRRELSSRKAKEKLKFSYIESESEDNPGFDEESDSDNDPVWVPNEKKALSDDDDASFGWPGRQTVNWKMKKARCNTAVKFDSKQNEDKREASVESAKRNEVLQNKTGTVSNESPMEGKGKKNETSQSKASITIDNQSEGEEKKNETLKNKTTTIIPSEGKAKLENGVSLTKNPTVKKIEGKDGYYQLPSQLPFQSGSFIALKKELEDLEEPILWRVDGKALLQKYEPFRGDDGRLKYRNVSTYSGWGPKNKTLYQPVPVRFILQNRFENIVEIIQEELVINEDKLREKLLKDSEKHSYAYEVFLQTLVSQALDSNFLKEIFAEKDEYFITSMDEMDGVCEEKRKKLLQISRWSEELKKSLCTWPKLNVKNQGLPDARCEVCSTFPCSAEINLEGEVYCSKTLVYCSPSTDEHKLKTFAACKECVEDIELFNKIAHLKYHTYNVCAKLVSEKMASDTSKDNTAILHDILADSAYITKRFEEVSLLWAQADLKFRRKKPDEIIV